MNRARSLKIVSRTSRVTRWRLNTALEQLNGTKCCCFFCCDQKHKEYSVFLLYCVVWVRKGSQFRLRRNIGRGEEGEDRETKRRRRILKQIGLTIPSLSEVSLEWLVIICVLSLSLSLSLSFFSLCPSLLLPLQQTDTRHCRNCLVVQGQTWKTRRHYRYGFLHHSKRLFNYGLSILLLKIARLLSWPHVLKVALLSPNPFSFPY